MAKRKTRKGNTRGGVAKAIKFNADAEAARLCHPVSGPLLSWQFRTVKQILQQAFDAGKREAGHDRAR